VATEMRFGQTSRSSVVITGLDPATPSALILMLIGPGSGGAAAMVDATNRDGDNRDG
jgi:hypothetical protein